MKKNKTTVLNLITVLSIVNAAVFITPTVASPLSTGDRAAISEQVVNLTTNERYDSALSLADSVIKNNPLDPYGWLLRATVLSARTVDFEDEQDFHQILLSCQQTENLTHQFFRNQEVSVERYFYLGMIELYRSIVRQREKSWLKSIRHVLKGGGQLNQAVNLDSTYWDVYYGLGMYRYYRSKHAGILRTVGLFADRRQEGIKLIEIAAQKGHLTRISARNSLAWIAYENGNYEETIRISRELLDEFPGRRAFNMILGKALIRSERWEEALPIFEALLRSVRSEQRNNYYNEIECLHKLAKAHFALNDWNKVIEAADEADKLQLTEYVLKRKGKDLSELRKMREDAGKLR